MHFDAVLNHTTPWKTRSVSLWFYPNSPVVFLALSGNLIDLLPSLSASSPLLPAGGLRFRGRTQTLGRHTQLTGMGPRLAPSSLDQGPGSWPCLLSWGWTLLRRRCQYLAQSFHEALKEKRNKLVKKYPCLKNKELSKKVVPDIRLCRQYLGPSKTTKLVVFD